MLSWITAYCPENIDDVTPESLSTIRDNDFWTLAEDYDVADELVSPALKLFKIEEAQDGYQLIYRPDGERQLAIRCWASPDRIDEEISEAKKSIGGSSSAMAESIAATMAVVAIELGAIQMTDMGIVIAYEVARWFGGHKNALIKSVDDDWSKIVGGGFSHLQRNHCLNNNSMNAKPANTRFEDGSITAPDRSCQTLCYPTHHGQHPQPTRDGNRRRKDVDR